MSLELTSREALQLAAAFAYAAERMRAAEAGSEIRAKICESASRIALLRAHQLAKREEPYPPLSHAFPLVIFAVT